MDNSADKIKNKKEAHELILNFNGVKKMFPWLN